MATLLLFNVEDEAKRTAVRLLAVKLGYSIRDIPPGMQNRKIADLLTDTGTGENNVLSFRDEFRDEMMIMSGFRPQEMHKLLDGMRNNGCAIRLKCIVTETNRSWTAARLYKELEAEDQAMKRRTSKK